MAHDDKAQYVYIDDDDDRAGTQHKYVYFTPALAVVAMVTIVAFALRPTTKLSEPLPSDLVIMEVFHRYAYHKHADDVSLSDPLIDTFNVHYYKGISIKFDPTARNFVRHCLRKDQYNMEPIHEVTAHGKVVAAIYQLHNNNSEHDRFLVFDNSNQHVVTVLYVEGDIEHQQINHIQQFITNESHY